MIAAIQSVLHQTYPLIEIIVVDDASTDNSARVIDEFCRINPSIKFLEIKTNIGNCRAFNKGLALATGEFIIDLAADDILAPERVEVGVRELQHHGNDYGVHFSDAECIDRNGKHLWFHTDKVAMANVPQGDVYKELISRYFVCAPTVMCRKSVLDKLAGYDESLAFEDFDFWVRSSRSFKYCYSDKVLVKKRILRGSKSFSQYRMGSLQMRSIFVVCNKILSMNKSLQEMEALKKRVQYEFRQAVRTFNLRLAYDYFTLLRKINNQINQGTFPSAFPIKPA